MSGSVTSDLKPDRQQSTQFRSFEKIEWNIKAAGLETPQSLNLDFS